METMVKLKKVSCKNCKKIILRRIGRFNENIKLGWNFYCSKECEYKYRSNRTKIKCENCGKIFERTLSQISNHNYCSQSCAAVINNKKYPKTKKIIMLICKHCGEKYRKSTNNKKYCSIVCRRKAEQKTPKELVKIIKETTKKLQRVPSKRELKSINDSCIKIFGSWNNAVLAAGFTPNRSHNNRMYKRINTKAEDGHLCDSISELLIDNWLYKSGICHMKNVQYPKTHHKADWKVFNKNKEAFIEYFGLANDSPRYDRSIKKKKALCVRHNIHLIGIYPNDIYPKNFLDNNLKNKLKKFLK